MATILIDFENVNYLGLRGVDLINSNDTLIIFYSEICKTIKKEYMDIIEKSGCSFRLIMLLSRGKDNLDKYICVMAGEIHASGEKQIAIISKDKGFQAVIEFYKVLEKDDLRIVKADNIEQALISFNDSYNKERRRILVERLKDVNLDEMSARLKERETILAKIRKALNNTPYAFISEEVCDFVEERKDTNNKTLYTGAMHIWGRENGRELYNLIKKVV